MVVISVEVPDKIAKKFSSSKVVSSYELYEELQNEELLVDFGVDGIGKKEFNEYLSIKNSL